jgi:hypothetical protein
MSHIATGRAESLRDEEVIHGVGISVGAMRSVARRQARRVGRRRSPRCHGGRIDSRAL